MAPSASRRAFLKVGLFGALALATAGGLYRMTRTSKTQHRFMMDDAAKSVLAAIVPVFLRGMVAPASPDVEAAVIRVRDTIAGLPLSAQKEIQDLFALLALAPSRRFLAGVRDDWNQAKQEDLAAFLQGWRVSRLALFQSAYHGLHDLVIGSWYSHESTWASIGYPGPIQELS